MASQQQKVLMILAVSFALATDITRAFPFPPFHQETPAPAAALTDKPTTAPTAATTDAAAEEAAAEAGDGFGGFLDLHVRPSQETTSTPLPQTSSTPLPCMYNGFHTQLLSNVQLPGVTTLTMQGYSTERTPGIFGVAEGCHFDTQSGVFTAPTSEVYFLASQVHIRHSDTDTNAPVISVAICINQECDEDYNASLMSRVSLISQDATVATSGLLWMEAGQSVRVQVKNANLEEITILARSSFMAYRITQ